MKFGPARYLAGVDIDEAIAHETAYAYASSIFNGSNGWHGGATIVISGSTRGGMFADDGTDA
jgi:hypothetical protein